MKPTTAAKPLRADAERNKLKIIDCARELLARKGLEITLDDVAARAGVGVGTVYRRFANKQELIDGILEQRLVDVLSRAEVAAEADDPWAAMVDFFEFLCRHMAADRGLGHVVLGCDDGLDRIAAVRSKLEPTIDTLIKRAQKAGKLRPDVQPGDLFTLVRMIVAGAEVADEVDEDNWRRYFALVIDSLAAVPDRSVPLPGRALTPDEILRVKSRLHGRAS
ncbi:MULTISPECIES: TetR/AcrR family transcriptional regulator [Nocardiaceae]|uniref:AcrR family transcriptional regulator n=1 Tax=Rhodococcoides corynebacterioides TaxID=53972 RepID=A0ABS2KUA4_9NOCA|nr:MULTISPECIES: TetR/AcrR family transcriptional regulator [Rhodococcus]MBM7415386.1 AcrR family transcriptional regulator [Rhodococcus corynebacterioides]MBP1117848.1 AcrR family transcriptional regulator [Rhodococcus sp. PvP016]